MTAPPILYEPSAQRIERATLTRFMGFVEQRRGLGFDDYDALWRWSVDDLDGFWSSIWEFFDVRASGDPAPVLGRRAMPGAEWFPNTRLNYAEHIFRDRNRDEVAVVHASELRELAEITWGELGDRVARVAAGLRSLGVARGDRVVAYMPNIPEALVAFLAVASIGAIWSSAAPEFGARSVVDRFEQIEPKLLLAVDGYRYGGRDFDRVALVGRLREALGTLEHTVLLPYLSDDPELDGAITWDDLLALGYGARLEFERVAFGDPLWVLYSSGTTGLPKAIVHSQGGILIEQLKKGHLHLDLQRGERMFWFTTTGWMMWNFLVGCLLTDAAIVLYDGSAGHPDVGGLWRLAERAGITCFGTSAGYIGACMKAGVEPGRQYDLARLAAVGSTGSPLPPEGFRWVYDHVGRDLWLYSTSGGTDLCTAFVSGCPLLPV